MHVEPLLVFVNFMYYVCFVTHIFVCHNYHPTPLNILLRTITRFSTSIHYYCIIITSAFIKYTNLLQLNIFLAVFSSATPEPQVHLTTAFFFFLPAPPPSAQYNPSCLHASASGYSLANADTGLGGGAAGMGSVIWRKKGMIWRVNWTCLKWGVREIALIFV